MPQWLIQWVLHIALKFGVPAILNHLPWLPVEIKTIIQELLKKLEEHQSDILDTVEDAKLKISEHFNSHSKI